MARAEADPKDVALSALTHLIRLMGAELTAGRHRDDAQLLECALRIQLQRFEQAGSEDTDVRDGIALAAQYLDKAIDSIRRQAAAVHAQQAGELVLQLPRKQRASEAIH